MTADIETVGAMVTAGLAAHQLDNNGAPAQPRSDDATGAEHLLAAPPPGPLPPTSSS